MRIYGLDFTSNPSALKASPSKFKGLTLAACWLENDRLTVQGLEQLNGEQDGDFSLFSAWLNANDRWSAETKWHAGIDFPLGMPIEAIEYFGWLKHKSIEDWTTYVSEIFAECSDISSFEEHVHRWVKRARDGSTKRVFLLRRTDTLAGFAGASPSSPMKVHPYCNPAVGRMFFVGSKCLIDSEVSIHPVRITNSMRSVAESYPKLVADQFVNGAKYKDGTALSSARSQILNGLESPNVYGVTLAFQNDSDRDACLSDESGDTLDSVLSAVQAGWSYSTWQKSGGAKTSSYGIPSFTLEALSQAVRLEGWIIDPLLIQSLGKDGLSSGN